ncbi:MAG: hypothetical protein DRJ47_02375 [Thermoprotei archaeon]|nr:MAG: hypothetical protein DRJ47_02375 [Thermoprotei archaeon]
MRPPCEIVTRYFLPQVRARIIRILVEEKGLSISRVARLLKVTPSAAVKYKSILKGDLKWFNEEELERLARRIADALVQGSYRPSKLIAIICRYCASQRISGSICILHKFRIPELSECNICEKLFSKEVKESSERVVVLRNLVDALSLATSNSRILLKFIPEVRTNIAMAVSNAKSIKDIAAFPGRLTEARGMLVAYTPPEFGGSRHLASILLEGLKIDPKLKAITCIKYDKRVEKALRKLDLNVVFLKKHGGARSLKDYSKALRSHGPGFDVLVDKGGYGIEPVVYVFGVNAVDAVRKMLEIARTALG